MALNGGEDGITGPYTECPGIYSGGEGSGARSIRIMLMCRTTDDDNVNETWKTLYDK